MLKPGTHAPAFSLPDSQGNQVTLSDLRAAGSLLLYFYPADFTPLCTREACMFRDMHTALSGAAVRVAGISRQGSASKLNFARSLNLPFTLLADESGTVCRAYQALFLGVRTRRITYLISPQGMICDAVESNFTLGPHLRMARRGMSDNRQEC